VATFHVLLAKVTQYVNQTAQTVVLNQCRLMTSAMLSLLQSFLRFLRILLSKLFVHTTLRIGIGHGLSTTRLTPSYKVYLFVRCTYSFTISCNQGQSQRGSMVKALAYMVLGLGLGRQWGPRAKLLVGRYFEIRST